MSTIAAIDCGTNSVRLLVLRADGEELVRETRLARLGQGVDATGRLHPDALRRVFAVCDEYAEITRRLGVERLRFVATSAARDATNRDDFFAGVRQRLGVAVDVISGDEEALLTASGVLSGITAPLPAMVIDIGGGSTELVLVAADGSISNRISLDIGSVRITERFLHTDPATLAEQLAARQYVGQLLDQAGFDYAEVRTCIGVAGTVTSMAATVLGLTEYSREAVHGTWLTREHIEQISSSWLGKTAAEIAAEPLIQPLRAEVIGGGSLILDEISRRVPGGSVLVSETDILDGIALEMLR